MGTGYRQRHGDLLSWSLFLLVCLPAPLLADDLLSTYHQALQQAPQLRIIEADRQAAEARRRIALSGLLPSIELNAAQSSINKKSIVPAAPADTYTSNHYAISLSQPIYDGSASSAYDSARLQSSSAAYTYQRLRQDLMVDVARAYFQLLAAQSNLSLARAEQEALELELKDARKRYRLGINTMMEVHETQARFDLSLARVLEVQLELDTYREQLSLYTGKPVTAQLSGLDNMVLYSPNPASLHEWEQISLQSHPKLKASNHASRAAKAHLAAQQKTYLPTLEFAYNYQQLSNDGVSALEQNTQTVGIEFTLPLYSGGESSARVAQARALFHKAQAEETLTRQRVQIALRQAFYQLKSNIKRVKAFRRVLMSQKSALKATQIGVKIGKRSHLDLLNARQDMQSAKYNYNQARFDYLISNLELYRSAGILDESKLQVVNNWLQ